MIKTSVAIWWTWWLYQFFCKMMAYSSTKVKYHQWTRANTSELIIGLLFPTISMETMTSHYLMWCWIHVFLSLIFSLVSQGHIWSMGKIKDKKKITNVKLVQFVMINSTGRSLGSKGIHPHNVLVFCRWSLPWTRHSLQVSNLTMMINAYVLKQMDKLYTPKSLFSHVLLIYSATILPLGSTLRRLHHKGFCSTTSCTKLHFKLCVMIHLLSSIKKLVYYNKEESFQ